MKRWIAILAAGLVGSTLTVPAAVADTCRTPWGSTAERAGDLTQAEVVGVRAGAHPCFDRLVVDLAGRVAGARVSYVAQVREDGSGRLVPLRGGARLQVIALAPSRGGRLPMPSVTGLRTFRQVAFAGSFEGQTTLGLGVRARLPFRVLTVGGAAPRLVIDVAHNW